MDPRLQNGAAANDLSINLLIVFTIKAVLINNSILTVYQMSLMHCAMGLL